MANDKVKFLGNEYEVSDSLKTYVTMLQFIEQLRDDQLMPLLITQMKDRKSDLDGIGDFAYFEMPLHNVGEQVVKKLAQMGVYDVTVTELVDSNMGYTQLKNHCKSTLQDRVKILRDSFEEWVSGFESAQNTAASKVTGSGTGIITSSFIAATAYSMMEASVVKKQADKANIEYQNEIERLNARTDSKQEQAELKLMKDKYFPGVASALNMFASELLDISCRVMGRNGIVSYNEIKQYDLKRSCDLLKNLTLVDDKKPIIEKAFVNCPYNPDVYQALIDCDLLDLPSFKTAKYYMQADVLSDGIKRYCQDRRGKPDDIQTAIQIWMVLTDESHEEVIAHIYEEKIKALLGVQTLIADIADNEKALIDWLRRYVHYRASEFIKYNEEKVRSCVENYIQMPITEDEYQFFCAMGVIDNSKLISDGEANTLETIRKKYIDRITASAMEYICRLHCTVANLEKESKTVREEYEEAVSEYRDQVSKYEYIIKDLFKQRSAAGILFWRVKKIDVEIENTRSKLKDYKEKCDPQKIKNEFNEQLKQTEICQTYSDLFDLLSVENLL